VTRCTHGGIATNIAVGARCPYCAQIVTVEADVTHPHPVARGEVSGSAGALDGTPREFAPEVSSDGNALAGSSSLVVRLGGNHRSDGPTLPPGPSPARGLPSANAQPGPSLLDLIDATPTARITDPATSHQAAAFQSGKLRESHRLVLTTLSLAPLTDFELGARTGKAQTSIGCRRGELTRAGMVADTGNTRPAPSGAPAAVWAITDLGRQALARELARSAA